jgi:SnoaL-like domain
MPHSNPLTGEAADRQALRELVDAWARCADRRLSQQQAELFTPDGTVTVYLGDPATTEPVQRLQGHAQLAEAFKVLDTYKGTPTSTGKAPSPSTSTTLTPPWGRPIVWRTTCGWKTGNER